MKKPQWRSLIALMIILLGVAPAAAQEVILFSEDFEGDVETTWDLDPGWALEKEGNNTTLAGRDHSWARLDQIFPADFRLTFKLNMLQGGVHIVTHLTERGRYYIGLGDQPATLNKQYFPDDFREDLVVAGDRLPVGTWVDIELISEGNHLTLTINGVDVWSFEDHEKLAPGALAFETLEGSHVRVDEITVYALGDEVPVEEATPDIQASDPGKWIRTGGPLGGLGYDVRMHPENPDKMYVTDAFAGVFISEDGGKSWHPSNQGITDRTGESQDAIPVFCLTVDPNNPDIVWSGTQFSGGIFKSTDGGETWTRKTSGITLQDGLTFRGITVHPQDSKIVFAAGEISSWALGGEPRVGREFDRTKGALYKSQDGGESWREVWRGNNLGRYIWINPQDARIMYLSTGIFDREAANSNPETGEPGGEGVLKSTDGGESWQHANQGLGNLYVGSLYMHPEDPDVLLAGTGNNQYWQGSGIYLTTDGAASWTKVYGQEYFNINSVEFSEANPQIAYAGEAGYILRSEDGGRTWKNLSGDGWGAPGVRGGFPIDFQVDPRDPFRLFANNYGGGNFLSEDGGKTWQVASKGYTGAQVRSLAVDPREPARIYAAARSGIFVSHDAGKTWMGMAYKPYHELEWNAVAVDPENPAHVLAGNNWRGSILNSEDGAGTWEEVSPQPGEGMGIRTFAFAPSQPDMIYAGTAAYYSAGVFSPDMPAEGVYRSQDGGQSWEQSTTGEFADAHIVDLSVDVGDPRRVYAATTNYGLLRSRDGGEAWEQINQGLTTNRGVRAIAVHPQNSQILLAGVAFGGVYRSEDGGESWQGSSAGMNPEANISDLVFDPLNPQVVYLSDLFSGVYRSRDGGITWQSFSTGLRMRAVNQLAISSDGAHLYAATEGEGVYRLDVRGQPPAPAEVHNGVEEEELEREEDLEGDPQEEEPTGPTPEAVEDEGEGEGSVEKPSAAPGNQFCPGSYLPLAALLLGVWVWRVPVKGQGRRPHDR